jgi:hypothetical protein
MMGIIGTNGVFRRFFDMMIRVEDSNRNLDPLQKTLK